MQNRLVLLLIPSNEYCIAVYKPLYWHWHFNPWLVCVNSLAAIFNWTLTNGTYVVPCAELSSNIAGNNYYQRYYYFANDSSNSSK